ncbi:hypothetical protein K432DRAFT_396137 [Lepidopterella palustris CBS 459.81]|uniref:Uncharacterized protein n=1 Tax=Lepidopterella palustris CBS 459.81 TaxID=1314670 RepID=A0A8E2E3U5_9PEZI|nr:hypothetical protein K432DRAFT_396137 [Lepidopterella palustris CBS 459.81]
MQKRQDAAVPVVKIQVPLNKRVHITSEGYDVELEVQMLPQKMALFTKTVHVTRETRFIAPGIEKASNNQALQITIEHRRHWPNIFPFFELPAELRIRIYKEVIAICYRGNMRVPGMKHIWTSRDTLRKNLPKLCNESAFFLGQPRGFSMLAASRQARLEIAPLIFATKRFTIGGIDLLNNFTTNIGNMGLESIENLTLAWCSKKYSGSSAKESRRIAPHLARFKRLKYLTIVICAQDPLVNPTEFIAIWPFKQLRSAGIKTINFNSSFSNSLSKTVFIPWWNEILRLKEAEGFP